jgi:methionyl-tRNA formyltransferase
MKLRAPAVKEAALALGLDVHQPVKVKTGNLDAWLRAREVDIAVVLAYGRILPRAVLDVPRLGCVNLHASLLPKFRGAAPIQYAIWSGDTTTGISLMQMEEGLDTGPVFCRRELAIDASDDAGTLAARLAELAQTVVEQDLPRVLSGELRAVPQDEALASLAPPIEKAECALDFNKSAAELGRQIRALSPRPGATARLAERRLRITQAAECPLPAPAPPGRIEIWDKKRILVATGSGTLEILRAQLEGRKELAAQDLANGRVVGEGDILG